MPLLQQAQPVPQQPQQHAPGAPSSSAHPCLSQIFSSAGQAKDLDELEHNFDWDNDEHVKALRPIDASGREIPWSELHQGAGGGAIDGRSRDYIKEVGGWVLLRL